MNMHRFLTAVLTIAICSTFWWGTFAATNASANEYQMPPQKYDHSPNITVKVRYQIADLFKAYCGTNHPKVGGCAIVSGNTCYVTIRSELNAGNRALVLRHEQAHCNGWPQNHATDGARVVFASARN
jgi:hypothetical protein